MEICTNSVQHYRGNHYSNNLSKKKKKGNFQKDGTHNTYAWFFVVVSSSHQCNTSGFNRSVPVIWLRVCCVCIFFFQLGNRF